MWVVLLSVREASAFARAARRPILPIARRGVNLGDPDSCTVANGRWSNEHGDGGMIVCGDVGQPEFARNPLAA
jgi:hypothetical protein